VKREPGLLYDIDLAEQQARFDEGYWIVQNLVMNCFYDWLWCASSPHEGPLTKGAWSPITPSSQLIFN
jgi:hypothetical protein